MPSLLDMLGQTWPARMAKSAYGAVTLPGDVYAGRVAPLSDEAIGRAADLAGTVASGTLAGAPRGALGSGPTMRAKTPIKTVRLPIEAVEHGESAMPGGRLTAPEAEKLIADYAGRPTKLPPVMVIAPEEAGGKYMIYDGSMRLEAAKRRGAKDIEAYDPAGPLLTHEQEAEFLKEFFKDQPTKIGRKTYDK
jgi:uncharacterized ParB-like nuclease family protein